MPVKTLAKKQPNTSKQAKATAGKLPVITQATISNEGLPDGWRWVKLGEFCEVVTGTTPPKADPKNYGNDIPFFKPPHLWDTQIYETEEKLSIKGAENARVVPPNTVLVTCIGNLGRTGFVKKTAAFNQQINAILENDGIDGKYIFYQAQSPLFKRQLEKLATGTTVSIVNKGNFETIEIPLPPKTDQHAIVSKIEELLSELDKGKQQLETAQQQLKIYRQAVLKWAFEGKNLVPFEEFIESSQNGLSKRSGTKGEEYKVLRLADITNNSIDESSPRTIIMDINEILKYRIHQNDLICIRVNGSKDLVGKLIYVSEKNESACWAFCDHFIRFTLDSNKAIAKFFHYYFSTVNVRKYIHDNMVTSAGQNTVSQGTLKNVLVPKFSLLEQQLIVKEIESRLSVCDKVEETITTSLAQAETLRQSILKKAFQGKLI